MATSRVKTNLFLTFEIVAKWQNVCYTQRSYRLISLNQPKMTLWHEKKNHYPPRWISTINIWSPTLFPKGITIFQGVLTKFNFSMKLPHLEKFADLIKDLKYEHQSIFPLWGRVNLILGIGTENQIFFLRT